MNAPFRQPPKPQVVIVRRVCLVCDWAETVQEPQDTDAIGPPCSRCHAPTERLGLAAGALDPPPPNPHAAALGRLGGLKGGPARAAALTARRRRAIARQAALARWHRKEKQ
jgi:hypothetical protein